MSEWWCVVGFAPDHLPPGSFFWKVSGETQEEAIAKLRKRYPEATVRVFRKALDGEKQP